MFPCLKRCSMSMGRVKLPAAVPDKHKAFARDLFASKYRAVRMIPKNRVMNKDKVL